MLRRGTLEVAGRIRTASNATLLCTSALDGVELACVHKPVRGEAPLWDFPDGTLAGREVGAYLVSEAAGLGAVPPTVLREGPFGPGSAQLWVTEDEGADQVDVLPAGPVPAGWLHVLDAEGPDGEDVVLAHRDSPALRRLAVLDVVTNNADRKGGHVLASGGAVLGVDHGLCFHVEDKLRTVLWGFAGTPLLPAEAAALQRLAAALGPAGTDGPLSLALVPHLRAAEVARLALRTEALLAAAALPEPPEDRHVLPWPPF